MKSSSQDHMFVNSLFVLVNLVQCFYPLGQISPRTRCGDSTIYVLSNSVLVILLFVCFFALYFYISKTAFFIACALSHRLCSWRPHLSEPHSWPRAPFNFG